MHKQQIASRYCYTQINKHKISMYLAIIFKWTKFDKFYLIYIWISIIQLKSINIYKHACSTSKDRDNVISLPSCKIHVNWSKTRIKNQIIGISMMAALFIGKQLHSKCDNLIKYLYIKINIVFKLKHIYVHASFGLCVLIYWSSRRTI